MGRVRSGAQERKERCAVPLFSRDRHPDNQTQEASPQAQDVQPSRGAAGPPGGDLPAAAAERLRAQAQEHLFTSDLSINEYLATRQAGFEPLGLVLGSSIYHIGLQMGNWNQNQELGVLSETMYRARDLAMTRMEEEARALGADGVVGVRLDIGTYEWGENLAEFIAVGTAVQHRAAPGSARLPDGSPFTSALSGQELLVLSSLGEVPLKLVMGNCVYHVAHQSLRQTMRTIGNNVEMANYTQGLYSARELAMERLQVEAKQAGARGVVGLRLEQRNQYWGSHIIEYFAIGTAVALSRAPADAATPTLSFVLPLDG
jgi:uncharacterized protein YbjQ (UPF0145 family)